MTEATIEATDITRMMDVYPILSNRAHWIIDVVRTNTDSYDTMAELRGARLKATELRELGYEEVAQELESAVELYEDENLASRR
jgi:hypothetical protein